MDFPLEGILLDKGFPLTTDSFYQGFHLTRDFPNNDINTSIDGNDINNDSTNNISINNK